MSGESGSGSGATINVITGFRVETRRIRIAAPGRIGEKICVESPADCCEETANECCVSGAADSLAFAFAAPIGAGGAEIVISGDLIRSNEKYAGTFEGDGSTRLTLALACTGGVWFASGAYTFADGRVKRFTVELSGTSTLEGAIEVPGAEDGYLVIAHPCAVPESGESGESGGSGAGLIACPGECGPTTAILHDQTGNCTCYTTATYVGPNSGQPNSVGYWSLATCPSGVTVDLRCIDGFFRLFMLSGAGVTGLECDFVAGTSSPLSLTYQLPELGINCGGSGSTRITITC